GYRLEAQAVMRVAAVRGRGVDELRGRRPAAVVARAPAVERRPQHLGHAVWVARVNRGEELPRGGEGVAALPRPRRVGPAAVMPLLGHVPEEDALVVLLPLQRGAVLGHRDELLARERDRGGVAEGLRTAGHAVV